MTNTSLALPRRTLLGINAKSQLSIIKLLTLRLVLVIRFLPLNIMRITLGLSLILLDCTPPMIGQIAFVLPRKNGKLL